MEYLQILSETRPYFRNTVARAFAAVRADGDTANHCRNKRCQDDDPHHRPAGPFLLRIGLRIFMLILRRVGSGHFRTVDEINVLASVPCPVTLDFLFRFVANTANQVFRHVFADFVAGFAIRAGVRGTRCFPCETRKSRTRMTVALQERAAPVPCFCTGHLREKRPERQSGCKHVVFIFGETTIDIVKGFLDICFGKNVGEML